MSWIPGGGMELFFHTLIMNYDFSHFSVDVCDHWVGMSSFFLLFVTLLSPHCCPSLVVSGSIILGNLKRTLIALNWLLSLWKNTKKWRKVKTSLGRNQRAPSESLALPTTLKRSKPKRRERWVSCLKSFPLFVTISVWHSYVDSSSCFLKLDWKLQFGFSNNIRSEKPLFKIKLLLHLC